MLYTFQSNINQQRPKEEPKLKMALRYDRSCNNDTKTKSISSLSQKVDETHIPSPSPPAVELTAILSTFEAKVEQNKKAGLKQGYVPHWQSTTTTRTTTAPPSLPRSRSWSNLSQSTPPVKPTRRPSLEYPTGTTKAAATHTTRSICTTNKNNKKIAYTTTATKKTADSKKTRKIANPFVAPRTVVSFDTTATKGPPTAPRKKISDAWIKKDCASTTTTTAMMIGSSVVQTTPIVDVEKEEAKLPTCQQWKKAAATTKAAVPPTHQSIVIQKSSFGAKKAIAAVTAKTASKTVQTTSAEEQPTTRPVLFPRQGSAPVPPTKVLPSKQMSDKSQNDNFDESHNSLNTEEQASVSEKKLYFQSLLSKAATKKISIASPSSMETKTNQGMAETKLPQPLTTAETCTESKVVSLSEFFSIKAVGSSSNISRCPEAMPVSSFHSSHNSSISSLSHQPTSLAPSLGQLSSLPSARHLRPMHHFCTTPDDSCDEEGESDGENDDQLLIADPILEDDVDFFDDCSYSVPRRIRQYGNLEDQDVTEITETLYYDATEGNTQSNDEDDALEEIMPASAFALKSKFDIAGSKPDSPVRPTCEADRAAEKPQVTALKKQQDEITIALPPSSSSVFSVSAMKSKFETTSSGKPASPVSPASTKMIFGHSQVNSNQCPASMSCGHTSDYKGQPQQQQQEAEMEIGANEAQKESPASCNLGTATKQPSTTKESQQTRRREGFAGSNNRDDDDDDFSVFTAFYDSQYHDAKRRHAKGRKQPIRLIASSSSSVRSAPCCC